MGKSGNPAKRAEADAPAPREYDPTPLDENGVEDFDAFWSSLERKGAVVRVMGEDIELPPATPLEVELLAKRMNRRRADPAAVTRLLVLLFGEDRTEKWAKAGMDSEQLQVLLAYSMHRIGGGTKSMAEVAALLREQEAGSGEA